MTSKEFLEGCSDEYLAFLDGHDIQIVGIGFEYDEYDTGWAYE
jgi:hypothetical protein